MLKRRNKGARQEMKLFGEKEMRWSERNVYMEHPDTGL